MKRFSAVAVFLVVLPGLTGCVGRLAERPALLTPKTTGKSLVPARAEGTTLRVVSFNILYAGNRNHPWDGRREAVVAHLRDLDPDAFGLQEAEWKQIEELRGAFPDYTCIARGRDDGLRAGEAMAVFYRSDRFVLHTAETFWLSDTPEVPGSNTWGAACNRCATVAVLIDRIDGRSLGVCNTHLDHRGANARNKGSALIRGRLPRYGQGLPWVVTGDFNSLPGSTPHANLVGGEGQVTLLDTATIAEPTAPLGASTYHGYAAEIPEGRRIDWILVTPDFEALATGIGQYRYGGMFPSDHFSVWADLRSVR